MKRFLLFIVTLLFSAFALAAVNINTATKEELDALPEIGPVKAQAIIDYRNANGPFKTPEEVMKVNGIKEGTFGKIKGMISVSGASTPLPAMQPAPAAKAAAPAASAAPAAAKNAPATSAAPPPATAAPSGSPFKDAKTIKTEKAAADKAAKAKAKADADAAAKAKKDAKAAEAQAKKDAKAAEAKARKDAKAAAAKDATKGDAAMKSADKDEKTKK